MAWAMKPMKFLSLVQCLLAVLLCVLAGCASQQSGKSQAEAEVEKSAKKSKTIITAEQVPIAVKKAFEKRFPTVKPLEWKLKSNTIYEAEFTIQGTEVTAMFDSTGKWLETETAIAPGKIPQLVNDAAAKQFKGYRVIETQSIERQGETNLIYELHFQNATQIIKAQFSSEGTLLSQSAKAKK
jgi:hypothetical protein